MDRRFLSHQEVITASRDFVCVRTATYEDKAEALFLRLAFTSGGGALRNFGFCILSRDGATQLKRSRSGPNFVYASPLAMAKDLRRIAKQNPAKPAADKSIPLLPQIKNIRLGINVASCDGLPIVIALGADSKEVERLKKQLSAVAWDDELIGKFIYASTTKFHDLKNVSGAKSKTGFMVVAPDVYGLKGRLIKAINADVSIDDLKKTLSDAAKNFTRNSKSHGSHVRDGRRNGKNWKTEVPVPSPASRRSQNRGSRRE